MFAAMLPALQEKILCHMVVGVLLTRMQAYGPVTTRCHA